MDFKKFLPRKKQPQPKTMNEFILQSLNRPETKEERERREARKQEERELDAVHRAALEADLRTCRVCNASKNSEALFCPSCGVYQFIGQKCQQCQGAVTAFDTFCPKCGTKQPSRPQGYRMPPQRPRGTGMFDDPKLFRLGRGPVEVLTDEHGNRRVVRVESDTPEPS